MRSESAATEFANCVVRPLSVDPKEVDEAPAKLLRRVIFNNSRGSTGASSFLKHFVFPRRTLGFKSQSSNDS